MKRLYWTGCVLTAAAAVAFGGESAGKTRASSGKTMEPTVITSKRLAYDYQRSLAVFDENVVVVDPDIRIEADRVNVLFDSTNDVKSVTAIGNVRFWRDDKRGSCDKCIYVAKTGEIIMKGNARIMRDNDVVSGDEITFYLNDERMLVKPGHVVFFPKRSDARKRALPGGLKKKR